MSDFSHRHRDRDAWRLNNLKRYSTHALDGQDVVKVSELLPRESFKLSPEFSLIADAVIVDNGLGRGEVPAAVLRALLGVGVSGFSLLRHFQVQIFGAGGTELYWNIPEVDELRGVKLEGVCVACCVVLGIDSICCQGASGDAVCQRGVPGVFTDILDKFWSNPLRVGDPEDIKTSVIKLRDAARLGLEESHDNSVGINALQIFFFFFFGSRDFRATSKPTAKTHGRHHGLPEY